MPPRRSGNTLKSAQTVPSNQCSRQLKRVFTYPLVLLVFIGVGGVCGALGQEGPVNGLPSGSIGDAEFFPSVVATSINLSFDVPLSLWQVFLAGSEQFVVVVKVSRSHGSKKQVTKKLPH
jgi:hypothetical protein